MDQLKIDSTAFWFKCTRRSFDMADINAPFLILNRHQVPSVLDKKIAWIDESTPFRLDDCAWTSSRPIPLRSYLSALFGHLTWSISKDPFSYRSGSRFHVCDKKTDFLDYWGAIVLFRIRDVKLLHIIKNWDTDMRNRCGSWFHKILSINNNCFWVWWESGV